MNATVDLTPTSAADGSIRGMRMHEAPAVEHPDLGARDHRTRIRFEAMCPLPAETAARMRRRIPMLLAQSVPKPLRYYCISTSPALHVEW